MARESDLVAELRATVAALAEKNNHLESDLTSLRRDYASLEAVLDETGAMVMELQTRVRPFLFAAVPSHHPYITHPHIHFLCVSLHTKVPPRTGHQRRVEGSVGPCAGYHCVVVIILLAAAHPAKSNALFFVAKGDGSSHFSQNLKEHEAAVDRYQRKIMPKNNSN
jgi:hypothetical protein